MTGKKFHRRLLVIRWVDALPEKFLRGFRKKLRKPAAPSLPRRHRGLRADDELGSPGGVPGRCDARAADGGADPVRGRKERPLGARARGDASPLSGGRPAEGDGGGAASGARREAESLELAAPGGVLDQNAAPGDALRLTECFDVERRVLGVGPEEIEEWAGAAGAAEHRIEEDDVEAFRGLVS